MKLLHTALFVSLTACSVSAACDRRGDASSSPRRGRPRFRLLPGRPRTGLHVLGLDQCQEHDAHVSVAGQGHRTTVVAVASSRLCKTTAVVR